MLEKSAAQDTELGKMVTVVIPTLNEEKGIMKVLEELHSLNLNNILVVDGYSKDKTVEVAAQFGARAIHQQGKGKTGAMITAIDHVTTPFMLVMDGDFTYDASNINRLLQHMMLYDEIIGTRIPTHKDSMTKLHKVGNRIITKVFNLLLSTSLTDVCSGMYLLRTGICRELHLSTSGFDVEVEIAAQIASSGRITEVPINYRPRIGKQKLSTWRHGFKIIKSIIGLGKTYNPGVFYSMLSSMLLIPALLVLGNSAIEWIMNGRITSLSFFVGISMLLVAIQSMGVGVISLLLRRSELRTMRRFSAIMQQNNDGVRQQKFTIAG